jgi:hypothetical protein
MKRTALLRKSPTTAALTVKLKKCKACRGLFSPVSAWQKYCRSEACAVAALEAAKVKRIKAEDRAHREKLAAVKPLSHWLKKAEAAVNWYVRARDHAQGCISCHLPATWGGQWHASHFRSVGAASAVRFHLWNIHKACSGCNGHKGGNLAEYTPRLTSLIGIDRVQWLQAQNMRTDYGVDYLKRLAVVFRKKARRQEKRNDLKWMAKP